jgi:molecular chaperone GrpE
MSKHQVKEEKAEVESPEVAETPAPEPVESPEEESPEEKLAVLEAQVADLKDQYLRKAAEFENFRKRLLRDKQDAIDFANQKLFEDLIPIIDDFERAIKAAEAASTVEEEPAEGEAEAGSKDMAAFKALYEGISMIEKRLVSTLESKWGLTRFESAGEPFDPNRHEALMMEKSPDVEEATVAEDLMRGYTLKDRVIRPAKVKVVMPES